MPLFRFEEKIELKATIPELRAKGINATRFKYVNSLLNSFKIASEDLLREKHLGPAYYLNYLGSRIIITPQSVYVDAATEGEARRILEDLKKRLKELGFI